ncbi:MAG: hypothetical protein Fur0037_22510 [Planctomycetota bacterium]
MSRQPLCTAIVCLSILGLARAQTFDDLSMIRNRPSPYSSVLQLRAGMIGDFAKKEKPAFGLKDETGWDGSVYYRNDTFLGRPGTTELYAGRDGAFLSLHDHTLVGNETSSVIELKSRYFSFFREGYYRDGDFVPTGRYEGGDYEAYLGFGRPIAQDMRMELGPYYRKNRFSRSTDPSIVQNFTIPEDYTAYGFHVFLEQSTVQLDRRLGTPTQGFLLTVVADQEWNDSSGPIGQTGVFETELPSSIWRLRGRLEWYLPQSDSSVWEVFATGAYSDEKDRIVNYEAQHPQGNAWADVQLRYRIMLGDSVTLTPFATGQFTRILDELGTSSDKEFFLGYGAETWIHFSESLSMNAWYSFVDNESRPSVSVDDDRHGQHMFYAGMVARFGGQRR